MEAVVGKGYNLEVGGPVGEARFVEAALVKQTGAAVKGDEGVLLIVNIKGEGACLGISLRLIGRFAADGIGTTLFGIETELHVGFHVGVLERDEPTLDARVPVGSPCVEGQVGFVGLIVHDIGWVTVGYGTSCLTHTVALVHRHPTFGLAHAASQIAPHGVGEHGEVVEFDLVLVPLAIDGTARGYHSKEEGVGASKGTLESNLAGLARSTIWQHPTRGYVGGDESFVVNNIAVLRIGRHREGGTSHQVGGLIGYAGHIGIVWRTAHHSTNGQKGSSNREINIFQFHNLKWN